MPKIGKLTKTRIPIIIALFTYSMELLSVYAFQKSIRKGLAALSKWSTTKTEIKILNCLQIIQKNAGEHFDDEDSNIVHLINSLSLICITCYFVDFVVYTFYEKIYTC